MSPLVDSQSILSSILSQYGVAHPEDTIENFLEEFKAVVGVLPLISQLLAGTCPVEMSIPVWFKEDTVGNARACNLGIVEELKVEEKNLFIIFPIGATMQNSGKRKEVMSETLSYTYIYVKKRENKIILQILSFLPIK